MLLPELNEIASKYCRLVKFVFVYIMEAHAADEWPIKELEEEIPQHKTLNDRINAATIFFHRNPLHPDFILTVDNFSNDFVNLYCSWPFRYWVVQDGLIKVKCMPNGDSVSLSALYAWLQENISLP